MSYRPITDIWILARPKVKYYGAYPNGFLERARALLGVTPLDPVLHVCGGMARQYPAKPRGFGPNDKTLDLDPALTPNYLQSAMDPLPWMVPAVCDPLPESAPTPWPALIADPAYTEVDADHYAPGRAAFPKPNVILKNMLAVVRPGGRVGMLHYILPQPPQGRRAVRRLHRRDRWLQQPDALLQRVRAGGRMNAFLRLWQWYVEHPAELLLHFAALLSLCWIVGAVVFAVWQAHEERKHAQARQRKREFDAAMALTHDLGKRGPSGFQAKRIG